MKTLFTCLSLLVSVSAFAANVPADHCQIYIRRLQAAPSSHGSASLRAVVKVNWLGDGEQIERVGFYSYTDNRDLGNQASCHFGTSAGHGAFAIKDPNPASVTDTQLGEYMFSFPIYSGSVTGDCPGFTYSTAGTFFVQTNRNTYWVNPAMDSSQYFFFDANGYDSIMRKGGTYHDLYTDREDLRYYNPLGCR